MNSISSKLRSPVSKILNSNRLKPWKRKTKIAFYRSQITFNKRNHNAYYLLGKVRFEQRKFAMAVANLETATSQDSFTHIATNPNLADCYYCLGRSLYELGCSDKAIAAYQKSIELQPQFFGNYYHLSVIYFKQERWKETIAYSQLAIELNPQFSWSYYHLGYAQLQLERWQKAIDTLKSVHQIQTASSLFLQPTSSSFR